jgi:GntR family transcriptional regulator
METERSQNQQNHPFLKQVEVNFTLDTESGVPFYRQIIQLVENHVNAGKLKPGDRLPTIRALSVALKVNPNTIAKAYMEMEIRGIVKTQVGSGTYVADTSAVKADETDQHKKKIEEMILELFRTAKGFGISKDDVIDMLRYLRDK